MILKTPPTSRAEEERKKKANKDTPKSLVPKSFKMGTRMQQKSKGIDLDKGFEITDEDKKRAVANEFVIDCNKRKYMGHEPRLID